MTNTGSPNQVFALDPLASAWWEKLRHFPFDRGSGPRTFAVRLASEQGWSASFTTLVIGEYRRFLLLFALDKARRAGTAAGADEQTPVRIVPSEAVDKVWHLHLLYTQSYWETLCRDILGGPLHHLPADGSTGEAPVLATVYANTLDAYQRTFGQAAPESVWPRPAVPEVIDNTRMRSLGMTTGSITVLGALFFFAVLLTFQGMIPLGMMFLVVIGVAMAMAVADSRLSPDARRPSRRRAARGRSWFGGSDGGFTVGSGGSSDDYGAPAHHDGGHGGSSHDAGGHSHSCGGGHSCGGHGCGGHGCGGGCGGH